MAVDREFMYIGSAGPGPGGQPDGRTVTDGGRTGGQAEGGQAEGGRRADGRTDGRTEAQVQFFTAQMKNVFFCENR